MTIIGSIWWHWVLCYHTLISHMRQTFSSSTKYNCTKRLAEIYDSRLCLMKVKSHKFVRRCLSYVVCWLCVWLCAVDALFVCAKKYDMMQLEPNLLNICRHNTTHTHCKDYRHIIDKKHTYGVTVCIQFNGVLCALSHFSYGPPAKMRCCLRIKIIKTYVVFSYLC